MATDYDSDWHPDDVKEKLSSAGYAEFAEVVVEDRKLKVRCLYCERNLNANRRKGGLSGFKKHLQTDMHQRNMQNPLKDLSNASVPSHVANIIARFENFSMAVPKAEAEPVAECGNYNPNNNQAVSNSAHRVVRKLDPLSSQQMQQVTSAVEDTRRLETERKNSTARELGALLSAQAVPKAEAEPVAECGNYNPNNNQAVSNSAHRVVRKLDPLSSQQMQQATSTVEDTRRLETERKNSIARELGAMLSAQAMEARRQHTKPKSDWQQGDVQEKLRREGYGNFAAVMVVDEKLIIHCIYCGENIDANEKETGLCNFETHLMTDKHLRNVQKEYEDEISGVTDTRVDQQPVHPHPDSPPGDFVDNVFAAPPPAFRLPIRGQKDAAYYRWQMQNNAATGALSDMADDETFDVTNYQVENEKCLGMPGVFAAPPPTFRQPIRGQKDASYRWHLDDETFDVTNYQVENEKCLGMPLKSPHVTKPKWYWLDVNKKWVEYGSQSDKNVTSNATAEDIENAFLAHPKGHFRFTTNEGQKYDLDFARMVQKNLQYKTERKVRRVPEYSEWTEDSMKHEQALQKDKTLNASYTPDFWDRHADGERVKYVELDSCGKTSQEYQRIEALFKGTMQWTRVKSIKRVQSLEVFDAYDRKKTWMKTDKKDPKELHLFHGTAASNIKTICEQGFDWRISGCSTGTKYGKGSYFGVTADVASKYTRENVMFVCKVLVGDSCQGNPSYVRPPPKDSRYHNENMYDSCVDNIHNPTMYIIFKSEQAYPEYIIEYEFVQNRRVSRILPSHTLLTLE